MGFLKTLFYKYQDVMWYAAQARAEYAKIGSFVPETITIMTYLAVVGMQFKWWQWLLFYPSVMFAAAVAGKILVSIGITRYNTTLGNNHNLEIQEILTRLGRIEDKLK